MKAPGPPGRGELKLRVLSALVMAAGILAATWLGGWPFRLVWILVGGLVAYEWLGVVGSRHGIAAGLATVAAGFALAFVPVSPPALAGVSAAAALAAAMLIGWRQAPRELEACGVVYALAFALVTPALRDLPAIGFAVIIWTFAVVWLTDIAAFFTGRALGGPKLMPSVSPKKTWSGALGGAAAGTLGGYGAWAMTPAAAGLIGPVAVIIGSLAASAISQSGDLFESAIKRRFGAKDSSRLIPGHGGFLDRLDGYWAVLVFAGLALFVAATGFLAA